MSDAARIVVWLRKQAEDLRVEAGIPENDAMPGYRAALTVQAAFVDEMASAIERGEYRV